MAFSVLQHLPFFFLCRANLDFNMPKINLITVTFILFLHLELVLAGIVIPGKPPPQAGRPENLKTRTQAGYCKLSIFVSPSHEVGLGER
jgi:hypothetical protein